MSIKKQPAFEEDAERGRIENIAVAEIRCDAKIHSRCRIDPVAVNDYSDRMSEGDTFPPVLVVLVDRVPLLVDGFHRFEAAKLAKQKILRCEVRRGALRDAILLSTAVNAQHGLHRTWDDKRRAVGKLLGDSEWQKWSDREIARQCSVSQPFVSTIRGRLCPVTDKEDRQSRASMPAL